MSVRTVTVSVMWLADAASLFAHHAQMVLAQARGLSDATIASGLKEALQVGTQNAVSFQPRFQLRRGKGLTQDLRRLVTDVPC